MKDRTSYFHARQFTKHLGKRAFIKVLLSPQLEVAVERNRSRTNEAFDPSTLAPYTVQLHRSLLEGCRAEGGWIVIDNSDMEPAMVAKEILDRARVS